MLTLKVKGIPGKNSLTTMIASQGEWFKNIETDEGTVTLSVRKVRAQLQQLADAIAPVPKTERAGPEKPEEPKKPRGETGRERLARLAKEGIT